MCGNCLAPEGQGGVTLTVCPQCKLTPYCSKPCQTAHWKTGHKQHCLTPEQRRVQAPAPAQGARASSAGAEQGPDECPICLDPLTSGTVCTLPCTHTFHAACVAELRSFGIKQACPMCRADLPPGPEKLFEEATRRYFIVERRVVRGEASWGALTKAQQREMNEVIGLLRSAAEQGHANAQYNLGNLFDRGEGVKQDFDEAVRLYRKAADQGHAIAQCNLGTMYYQGKGMKQDFGEAVRLYRKAADQGHASAQCILGHMYDQGKGVKEDFSEAVRLYRKPADQGHAGAQCNLGTMYANGEGVKQDFGKAARLYRKAADQGDANAQFNLGFMYAEGQGVKHDFGEAVRLYRKAADQGLANAQCNLGAMYAEGEGVKQDYGEATRL